MHRYPAVYFFTMATMFFKTASNSGWDDLIQNLDSTERVGGDTYTECGR